MANPFMRKQGRNNFIPLIHGPSKGNLVRFSLSISLYYLSIKPLTIFTSPHYILTVVPRSQWRARITLQSQNCNVDYHFLHPSEECDGSSAGNFLWQAVSVRETSSGGFPFFPMEVPAPFCVSCNQPKRGAQPKDGFASI